MSKDINLNSPEWIDLVFEEKNKRYGAYYLRKTSSKRHWWALLAALAFVIVVSLLRFGILSKEKTDEISLGVITTTVELTNIEEMELPQETIVEPDDAPPPPPLLRETLKFTAPVIAEDGKVTSENQMKSQTLLTESAVMISIADIEGSNDIAAIDIADLKEIRIELDKEKLIDENKLFDKVDQMPEFPGGERELLKFIYANIQYPEDAVLRGVEGRVVLRFVVEKNGSIGEVRIQQSLDPACDQEAIRVIKMMPRWEAGKHQGSTVRVWFTQPITFELR